MLGAGSWGTALAIQCARAGHEIVLWGRSEADMAAMAAARCNERYLPGVELPPGLAVTAVLEEALTTAAEVLVAVPSHAFRDMLEAVAATRIEVEGLAWATKGFELETGCLPHEVAGEVLAPDLPTAVLAGPTFATEVGAGLPSAMTVASGAPDYALWLARALSTDSFRCYTSNDIVGVEVGGATKNVYAIGAGICDGLGFGANTRIALMTRGLAEMTRLGVALGADQATFMGLAGMGDLVLTCTDDQSRNRRFGLALAAGRTVAAAQHEIGQVVEGVLGARAVHAVAHSLGVQMPIVDQIYRILYEEVAPETAVRELMRRPIMAESR